MRRLPPCTYIFLTFLRTLFCTILLRVGGWLSSPRQMNDVIECQHIFAIRKTDLQTARKIDPDYFTFTTCRASDS